MRALILGGNGMLAQAVRDRFLEEGWDGDVLSLPHEVCDVQRQREVRLAMESYGPNVVVNCAAYHNLDACEREPIRAYSVNCLGPVNIALCSFARTRIVHFSTGYVFDGSLQRPYMESDLPRPLQAYGWSKLHGEQRLLALRPDALVIRTSALFGRKGAGSKGGSFVDRMLAKAAAGEHLRVVDDQWVNPTHVDDLAKGVLDLLRAHARGIVHLVNPGEASWYDLASEALSLRLIALAALRPCTTDGGVPRPANSLLDCSLAERFGVKMRHWRVALQEYLAV